MAIYTMKMGLCNGS